MLLMEFNNANEIDTTTLFTTLPGATDLSYALFDNGTRLVWESVGYASDATTTIIEVTFPATTTISKVLLRRHNFKSFEVYYNGTTTNQLYSTTTNSDTSTYLALTTTTCTKLAVKINGTITPDIEKSLGELYFGSLKVTFERNPSISQFSQTTYRKQVLHEMPDGGMIAFNVRDKYRATLGWQFISETFKNQLQTCHADALPLVYIPFPASSSWDGVAPEVILVGDFAFNYSDNVDSAGWSGEINVQETPGG